MTETVTTAAELDALLMAVSECAEAAVIQTADRRPYIITEDDSGTFWADSYWQEDEARGPWAAESIPLPWTVLYRPGAEPAPVKPSREDATEAIITAAEANAYQITRGWMTESDCRIYADAVLALLPGRTEAEVKAEALEEAADSLVVWGVLAANSLHVSSVRSWLQHRAAALLRGESHV